MSDEQDSWLESTLGVDVSAVLGGATDDTSGGAGFNPSAATDSVASGAWDLASAGWDAAAGAGAKVVSGGAGVLAGAASAVGADDTAKDLRGVQATAEADADRYFRAAEGEFARAVGDTPPPTERPGPPDSGGPPTDRPPPPTERPDRPPEGGPPTERSPIPGLPPTFPRFDISGATDSATDDAGAAAATGPVLAEDKIPFIQGETAFDEVDVEGESGEGGDGTPTGPTATATIAVKANGDGSFTITGSGFTHPRVSVRAVDDFLGEQWIRAESKDGKIAVKTPKICVNEGPIHFSVFAGTHPLVSDLLSNIAHSTCGPQEAPEKKDDEPKEDPDTPEEQTEKVHACLITTFGTKVKYFIRDMTSGKMLVDGVEKAGGEKICFDCESTGAIETGRVHYSRASDESGGGRTVGRITLVTHNTDTNMEE